MMFSLIPLLLLSETAMAKLIMYASPTEFRPNEHTSLEVVDDEGQDITSATWFFDEPQIKFVEGSDIHASRVEVKLEKYEGPSKLVMIWVEAQAGNGAELTTLVGINLIGSSSTTTKMSTTTTTPLDTSTTTTTTTTTTTQSLNVIGPNVLKFETPTEYAARTFSQPCQSKRTWAWECTFPTGKVLDAGLSQPSETSVIFYLKKSNKCANAIISFSCQGNYGFMTAHSGEITVDHV